MAALDVAAACVKIANIAEVVNQLTSDKGQIDVNGRTISYEARGHFYKWKFIWDCEAIDLASGTTVKATQHKSRNGATKHAITDLFTRLSAEGKI